MADTRATGRSPKIYTPLLYHLALLNLEEGPSDSAFIYRNPLSIIIVFGESIKKHPQHKIRKYFDILYKMHVQRLTLGGDFEKA